MDGRRPHQGSVADQRRISSQVARGGLSTSRWRRRTKWGNDGANSRVGPLGIRATAESSGDDDGCVEVVSGFLVNSFMINSQEPGVF